MSTEIPNESKEDKEHRQKHLPGSLTLQTTKFIEDAVLMTGEFDAPIIRQGVNLQIAEEQAILAGLIVKRDKITSNIAQSFNTLQATRDAVLITDNREGSE